MFSDVPQIREVFPAANYVAFDDGDSLVSTVTRLLKPSARSKLSVKARAALRKEYSVDVILARQLELLSSLEVE